MMVLEEKYRCAYEEMEQRAAKKVEEGSYTALGYTSNLDLLCEFKVERLNELLEEHMSGANLSTMQAADKIETILDLLQTIVYYCSRGIGGETDVSNVRMVEESFTFQHGMGGTAVQAALALAQIGYPTLVHLTDDSKEVCDQLISPCVHTISKEGNLVYTDKVGQTNEQEVHFIIQFKKGDCIRLEGQEVVIPCSNRLILTQITVNEFVPFSTTYFQWIEKYAKQVSSNVLSSFNGILDSNLLEERLAYVKKHIALYKRKNPRGIVFFEDAHYHDYIIKRLCLEKLCPSIDIMSLNEEELKYTLEEMYDFKLDTDEILSCINGAKYLCKKFDIQKGVIVHTKDYSMYVGKPLHVDIEQGLMNGNLLATAKAQNGSYGTKEEIRRVLDLEFSPKGLRAYYQVMEGEYAKEVTLVPSKYIDKPQYTIGLGDSFVGGVQMCF